MGLIPGQGTYPYLDPWLGCILEAADRCLCLFLSHQWKYPQYVEFTKIACTFKINVAILISKKSVVFFGFKQLLVCYN